MAPQLLSRGIATSRDYIDNAYNSYFLGTDKFQQIKKIEAVIKQLHAVMSDIGHSKKKLVGQFLADTHKEISLLEPNTKRTEAQLLMSLGRINASYKIMSLMGIYLTASGVFEKDTDDEDYYLGLLDRATSDIEKQLNTALYIYKPENKEEDENNARLRYTGSLANEIRNNLYKVFPDTKNPNYRRADQYFNKVAKLTSVDEAKKLIKTSDFQYVRNILQNIQIINSGDIDGFQSDVDLTVATQFNFAMINELITGAR